MAQDLVPTLQFGRAGAEKSGTLDRIRLITISDEHMTTIGASLTITGEVTSHEDVTIHGKVNGKISMQSGCLLVAPSADVRAEAQVSELQIHGTFCGDVAASKRVELANTSQVNGTLVAPAVLVQDGAVFNGMIDVNRRTPEKQTPEKQTTEKRTK